MKKVCGLVLGAGTTAQYIGLGFQPDEVVLRKLSAEVETLKWNRHFMRNATQPEGILWDGNDDEDYDVTVLTDGNGIVLYGGGDVVSAASANMVVPVTHPTMVETYGANHCDTGSMGRISKWTASSGAAGYLNAGVNTTYVGVGSRVVIRPTGSHRGQDREYGCVAITNDGDAASEFTLSDVPVAGDIVFISYKHDFAPLPVGYTMPAGIIINETGKFNYAAALFVIEATQW